MNESIEEKNEEEIAGLPLVRLSELGEDAIIDETNLAKLFGRCRKSVKRSVARGELPLPVRLFGQDVWLAGQLALHIKNRIEWAAKEKARLERKPV